MKTFALLLLLCLPAFASKKHAPADYQDGVLESFKEVATGQSCNHATSTNGNISGDVHDNGHITGDETANTTGKTNCSTTSVREYTVAVGNHTYVVEESYRFLNRLGFLHNLLPGTPIKVRVDSKGIYIEKGSKETKYDIVEAR